MKILIINGPNLNILGRRDPKEYGARSLKQINTELLKIAHKQKFDLKFFQSNHEGKLIDFIQENAQSANGILINPGALTHYGYSLRDALTDTELPIIEIHLSNIDDRENFRQIDVLDGIVIGKISGHKEKSYYLGLDTLIKKITSK